MSFVIQLVISVLAAYFLMCLLPWKKAMDYVIALAVVIMWLNMILPKRLIFFTIPMTFLTFFLFLFIVNVIIMFTASRFDSFRTKNSVWWVLLFGFNYAFCLLILR